MYIISSLLFALSVNIDAFLVGISYGIRKVHFTLIQNLIISLISFAGTFLSLFLGRQLLILLPASLGSYLGSGILFSLGIFYLYKAVFSSVSGLHAESLQTSLPLREVVLLGTALSLNNIGIGIGVGISGIWLFPTAAVTFLISAALLPLGNYLGNRSLFSLPSAQADLLSGVLLIVLGLCTLLFI